VELNLKDFHGQCLRKVRRLSEQFAQKMIKSNLLLLLKFKRIFFFLSKNTTAVNVSHKNIQVAHKMTQANLLLFIFTHVFIFTCLLFFFL